MFLASDAFAHQAQPHVQDHQQDVESARFLAGLPHGGYLGMAMLFAANQMPAGQRGRGAAQVLLELGRAKCSYCRSVLEASLLVHTESLKLRLVSKKTLLNLHGSRSVS